MSGETGSRLPPEIDNDRRVVIILVATAPDGLVRAIHWFDEGTFEKTQHQALKRALEWCESHRIDVDFLGRPPVLPRTPGDWRMLVASGPPYRVELWGQLRSL